MPSDKTLEAFERIFSKYKLDTKYGLEEWIRLVIKTACERLHLKPIGVEFGDLMKVYKVAGHYLIDYNKMKIMVDYGRIDQSFAVFSKKSKSRMSKEAAISNILHGLYHELGHYKLHVKRVNQANVFELQPEGFAVKFAEKEFNRFFMKLVTEGVEEY
ncbi:MAG: hypothetical protein PHS47_02870 [Methanocellales archaeon]|nr:hypothetical protein [Methanocellales archaeon]MDD3421228.1 hypothetical protein [Methanocellales archaeon]MDD4898391.1 hypothetical protein [Methanocellales archaeon]